MERRREIKSSKCITLNWCLIYRSNLSTGIHKFCLKKSTKTCMLYSLKCRLKCLRGDVFSAVKKWRRWFKIISGYRLSFHSSLILPSSPGRCCRRRLHGGSAPCWNFEPHRVSSRRFFKLRSSRSRRLPRYPRIAVATPPGNKEIRSSQEAHVAQQSFSKWGSLNI